MNFLEEQEKGQKILGEIIQKAWESPSFKEELLNNPTAAIEEVTGRDLSFVSEEGKRIEVQDQTDSSVIYVNIPAQPNIDSLELTEEELETIGGGSTPVCGAYAAGVVIGVGAAWLVSKL